MTAENPRGPLILCFDGSEAAERAIRIAPGLVGRGARAIVMGTRGLSGVKSAVLGSVGARSSMRTTDPLCSCDGRSDLERG